MTRSTPTLFRGIRTTPQRLAIALACASSFGAAEAGRQPPRADLAVDVDAPSSVNVNQPATYLVTVTNRGRDASSTITASVVLPVTATSPQVYVLGAATPLDTRCRNTGLTMTCTLAGLRKGWSTTFAFNYTAPVAAKPLRITASASSSTADPVSGNNSDSALPSLVHPARPITSASATVRGCTGSTALSAFEECTRFPSSIFSYGALLQANGSIGLGQPGYGGTWSQNSARTSLKMELFENQVKVAEFNGWAINGANCFHGLTTFMQDPNHVSPYEVCL